MDKGTWWATVHEVVKSLARLSTQIQFLFRASHFMCLPGNHQPPSSSPTHPVLLPVQLIPGSWAWIKEDIPMLTCSPLVLAKEGPLCCSQSLIVVSRDPWWNYSASCPNDFYTSPQTSGASFLFIFSWWPCFLCIKNESNQAKTLHVSSLLYPDCMHFLFAMITTSSLALGCVHFLSGPLHCLRIPPILPAGELFH